MSFAAVRELASLLIVKGGITMPMAWARATLVIFMLLLCQSIVTPPCLFVFRYLQICKTNFLTNNYRVLRYLLLIPLFISTSSCAVVCFASWPTAFDLAFFDEIAVNINVQRNTTYLVATLQKDGTVYDAIQSTAMLIGAIYLIAIMICALVIMLYCTRRIVEAARQSCNEKTRRLQMQLYKTLVAQFLIPFIFIHIPFYLSIIAPLFDISTGSFSNYLPFLFAWCPAINPLVILYFVRDYRKYLVAKLRGEKEEHSSSNSVFQNTSRKK
ncbi:hypothetical protein Y032_0168g160 [Ancylostoma ceylanicum]|uniref:7TM chemoreceptor n=1 Tax=Ancylostoma ceylanicum TaxID=53326 RepID=A0A016SW73_9BILA|nr:hypothetical protein Y032_0168g160 [Ancylostoma ceylanicum]